MAKTKLSTSLSWEDYKELLRPGTETHQEEHPEPVHILVVDDEANMLGPIVEFLEEAGYSVHGAGTATEAIEYLMGRQESHIVLTDIYMGPPNGLEFLELVSEVPLFTVRACMSGDASREEEAHRHGATHFIPKDVLHFGREKLLLRIEPLAQTIRDHDRATNDPLTGLPHDVGFLVRIRRALSMARHFGTPTSMLFVDGDGIKRINDTPGLGHDAGNAAIGHIAECLRECIRKGDELARPYGGDEFLVLLVGAKQPAAKQVALRAARIVGSRAITYGSDTFRVGISVGSATIHPDKIGDDLSVASIQLVKKAEKAMYARKKLRKAKWARAGSR